MRDHVAVLQNMLHSSCIVMPCHKCRALNAAIALLQSQQDGAQGGEAVNYDVVRAIAAEYKLPFNGFAAALRKFLDSGALRDRLEQANRELIGAAKHHAAIKEAIAALAPQSAQGES